MPRQSGNGVCWQANGRQSQPVTGSATQNSPGGQPPSQFGNIDWKDADNICQVIAEEIPSKVAADKAYQNAMKNSDKQNARIEHDKALQRVLVDLLSDHTELYKQFSDNTSFKKWLADAIFSATYAPPTA